MLLLTGLCHGYKSNTRKVGTNDFVDHMVLVEVQDLDQYGIPQVKTASVKLSKADLENGVQHQYDALKGKPVTVPVRVGPWASKAGNAGFDYWISGDRKPVNMQIRQPVAAAS